MYRIYPVFFYDKETQLVYPVVTITPTFTEDIDVIDEINRQYLEDMNLTIIQIDETLFGRTDPIVRKSFAKKSSQEMEERRERFYNGDFSAFSDEDLVFLAKIYISDFYK